MQDWKRRNTKNPKVLDQRSRIKILRNGPKVLIAGMDSCSNASGLQEHDQLQRGLVRKPSGPKFLPRNI